MRTDTSLSSPRFLRDVCVQRKCQATVAFLCPAEVRLPTPVLGPHSQWAGTCESHQMPSAWAWGQPQCWALAPLLWPRLGSQVAFQRQGTSVRGAAARSSSGDCPFMVSYKSSVPLEKSETNPEEGKTLETVTELREPLPTPCITASAP